MEGFNPYAIMKTVAANGLRNQTRNDGDYEDENGILICGKCGEPRQRFMLFDDPTDDDPEHKSELKVVTMCRCEREEEEREKRKEEAAKDMEKIQRLRNASLLDEKLRGATFDAFKLTKYNERNLKLCRRYAMKFDQMVEKDQGLIFWGSVGSCKSFAAVCIAMSFALSYLKVVEMPQGGSITIASLLPLMIYSYMFGTKKGVLAGFIYGILQAFQDTYILHPAQFLLDYPVAFSAIGLAGMFARVDALRFPQVKFLLGAIVAAAGRFLSHFLSGIFAFGTFATIEPVWLYSLIYQAGYVLPDIAIAIVLGVIVFSSKSFLSVVNRYAAPSLPKQAPKQKGETAAENK